MNPQHRGHALHRDSNRTWLDFGGIKAIDNFNRNSLKGLVNFLLAYLQGDGHFLHAVRNA